MAKVRVWVYRGLVFISVALMVASFLMPWWSMGLDIIGRNNDPVRIYAYGMRLWNDTPQEVAMYLKADQTPVYQTKLAFAYLGVGAALALVSTKLFSKAGRWVLSAIGISYIAWGIAALRVITQRIAAFGISLQGTSETTEWAGEYPVTAFSTLRFGFYLALFSGGLMLALSLLRPLIEGKRKRLDAAKVI